MAENNTKDWGKFKAEQEKMQEDETMDIVDDLDEVEDVKPNEQLGHPSYEALEEKLNETEQKVEEFREQVLRLNAKLDNQAAIHQRELAKAHKFGIEKFANNLLPVMDSLEQAVQLAEKHGDESMHEGLMLTMKLFMDTLSKSDIQEINPEGEAFDPTYHEAMSMQASPDHEANTVIAVFQKGYLLNGRVIRAAKVIVSK